tara:strand:+ start:226 stop:423 length:198 start_codon:yes stop_codon:yes gene_type:complete
MKSREERIKEIEAIANPSPYDDTRFKIGSRSDVIYAEESLARKALLIIKEQQEEIEKLKREEGDE